MHTFFLIEREGVTFWNSSLISIENFWLGHMAPDAKHCLTLSLTLMALSSVYPQATKPSKFFILVRM
jgi:hypothetical protein